jgi:hypothetical protein
VLPWPPPSAPSLVSSPEKTFPRFDTRPYIDLNALKTTSNSFQQLSMAVKCSCEA